MEEKINDILPGISVVIPNYNGKHLLEENLPWLYDALQLSRNHYEIIISDDCSTDDSIRFIRKQYPDIILIESSSNSGFSVTINKGIYAAQLELVLLLNNDIRLSESYFLSQLCHFKRDDTFGVMGQIREESGRVSEACKYPLESVFKINHFQDLDTQETSFTYYLSGANALVDRQKLIQLEGFNELFSPFYQEDLDLSLRAWRLGWTCYYEPEAVCYHQVSATIRSHNKLRFIKIINARNKLILHYVHLNGLRLFSWCLLSVFSLLIRWALAQTHYYKGLSLFLKKLPEIDRVKQEFETKNKNLATINQIKKLIRFRFTQVGG